MLAVTPKLKGTVGFNGLNDPTDVLMVQRLLNAHRKRDPRLTLLAEDGSNSRELEEAIAQFQHHVKAPAPGGVIGRIDPSGSAWRDLKSKPHDFRLEGRIACGLKTFMVTKTIPGLLYPLSQKATASHTEGQQRFSNSRSGTKRLHAGIDLYAPAGTIVRAMADGTVVSNGGFYRGTNEITVDHGDYLVRYGEIDSRKENIFVDAQGIVKRGQKLGKVGNLKGIANTMLHLEMYAKLYSNVIGLTDQAQGSCSPYKRRPDLIDPTPSINLAVFEPFVDDAPDTAPGKMPPAAGERLARK